MESGHPEEHIIYNIIAMETVYSVGEIMQGLIICGGNAEHSTDTRTLVTSNSCKSNTNNTTNQSVFGMLELSRHIGPLYHIQSI
eukprot:12132809-Heterocapsa_arctica.AAC.1